MLQSNTLKNLVPICELTEENLQTLIKNVQLETLPAGKSLFKRGDNDPTSYYLIDGRVALNDGNGAEKTISHTSSQSRFPLDQHRPRHYTATAASEIRFIRIDNDLLDVLLTWEQNAGYVVHEIGGEAVADDENDWMSRILQSRIFHRIPPANIQAMFMKIEATPVQNGEIVLNQGEVGDYYYIVKEGRCAVIRNAVETGNKPLQIAELEPGQGFGEEALLSDSPRNATIKMLSDGVLMRLSKDDFNLLLKAPVLNTVSYAEAEAMVRQDALWLDVRLMSEHHNSKIPGSLNIPLFLLRLNADKLMKNKKYIVYCDTGSRSASAAFILSERGYDVSVLAGGLQNLPAEISLQSG